MSFADFGPPLRVEGGLRPRSGKGVIGEHWWSRRFVAVLEGFALGTRLTRGRAYARSGQVLSLEVAPGLVTAAVQGSRPSPYQVRIALAPFPELVWAKVEVALAEQALCSASLLAGQLPKELEQVLEQAGAALFPSRLAELTMSCTCPDQARPCKHLAATFYLLADSFDDDPFRILHWRGRERTVLLARLRQLRGGTAAPVAAIGPRPPGAAAAVSGVSAATSGFWSADPPPPAPVHPDLPADLLLRQLPAPPAELGAGLADHLRELYGRMARADQDEVSSHARGAANPRAELTARAVPLPGRAVGNRQPR